MIEVNPKVICGENGEIKIVTPTSEQVTKSSNSFTNVGAGVVLSGDGKSITTGGAPRINSFRDSILNGINADILEQSIKWKINADVPDVINNYIQLFFGNNNLIVPYIEFKNGNADVYDEAQNPLDNSPFVIGDEFEIRMIRNGADIDYKVYRNGVLFSEYTHVGGVAVIDGLAADGWAYLAVANGLNIGTYTNFTFNVKYTRRITDAPNGYQITGDSLLSVAGTTTLAPNTAVSITLDDTSGDRAQLIFQLNDQTTPPNPVEIYMNLPEAVEISGPTIVEIGKPYFFNSNHPIVWAGIKKADFITETEGVSGVVLVPNEVGEITLSGYSSCNPALSNSFKVTVVEASDDLVGDDEDELITNQFYIDDDLILRSGQNTEYETELGACEEIEIKALPLWSPIIFIDRAEGRVYGAKFNGVKFTDIIIDNDNYFVNKAENYIGKNNNSFSFATRKNVSDSLSVTWSYKSDTSLDTKNIPANSTFAFRVGAFGAGFLIIGATGGSVGDVTSLQYSVETNSGTFVANTALALNTLHSFEVKVNKTLGRLEFYVDGVLVYSEIINVTIQQTSGEGVQSATYNGNAYTGGLIHISAVEGGDATFLATGTGGYQSTLTVHRNKAELSIEGNPIAGQVGKSYVLTGAPAGASYGIGGIVNGQVVNDNNPIAPKAVFTPIAEGDFDLTFTTDTGCVVHIDQSDLTDLEEFRVYGVMTFEPEVDEGNGCVIARQGEQLPLVVSGGSGEFTFKISGGNKISQAGLIEVTGNESFVVTVIDNLTKVELSIPLCVEFASPCVLPTETEESLSAPEPCCDVVMECNDPGQVLQAPSFLIDQPKSDQHNQIPILVGNGVTISKQFAEITSQSDNATAEVLPKSVAGDSYFFRVVSQLSLENTNSGEIRFGFKGSEAGIETALVFFTDNITRKVRVENDGVAEAGSEFEVVKGREFAYGWNSTTKKFELYVNNIKRFTSEDAPSHCGVLSLTVKFETAGDTIGGAVKFDSLTNTTNLGGVVIQSENKYTPPSSGFDGVEILEAVAGEFRKEVHIRVIQPILKKTRKNAFQFGVTANVYIGPPRFTRDAIRLSNKGVPDAVQNPCMQWMGKTRDGVTITLTTETQKDKADDLTVLKWITDALARVEFNMLSVNDLEIVSMVSNGMLRKISENHYGIGLPDYVEPFRVLIVFQIGGKGSNTYRVYELSNANSENELSLAVSNQGERSGIGVVIEATPDDDKPDVNSIGDIWTIQDCRYSNSTAVCQVG